MTVPLVSHHRYTDGLPGSRCKAFSVLCFSRVTALAGTTTSPPRETRHQEVALLPHIERAQRGGNGGVQHFCVALAHGIYRGEQRV